MDPNFQKFLREQRRLDETVIASFIDEKIDCYAANEMTEEQLMKYVPKIGDRMAIRQYCRREVAVLEGTTTAVSNAKASLMAKLNHKSSVKKIHRDQRTEKMSGNSNAQKIERAFQMGLFEDIGGRRIQVKERRGGGTRHLKAPKNATMAQLLETGKKLFFSNGKSMLGDMNHFHFTMRDFTEEELDPMITLGQQYEKQKVRMLRLYLSCKKNELDVNETSNIQSENVCALGKEPPHASAHGTASAVTTPQGTALIKATLKDISFPDQTNEVADTAMSAHISLDTVPWLSAEYDMGEEEDVIIVTQPSLSDDEEIVIGRDPLSDGIYDLDDTLPMDSVQVESFPTVQEPCQLPKTTRLRLHRGNLFQELNAAFGKGLVSVNDCLLEIEMVQPNGTTEKGEDNGGVLRNALSEYWETFVMKCTSGNIIKIPVTRHDMKDEWENIAKVMVLGPTW
ncbi:unnamed protein product [Knipowitschia caucasica]